MNNQTYLMTNNNNNNILYNHVLNKLQDYMFNEITMNKAIRYININDKNKKNNNINNKNHIDNIKKNNLYFIPKEKDTLFWCFYIIKYGESQYEIENKNILNEKKIKINFINEIRNKKNILKKYKFDTLSNIETNLVNDNMINLQTFFSLCVIENINIVFINKNKKYYYDFLVDDDKENIHYIFELSNLNKYGYMLEKSNLSLDYKNDYYKLENIHKPIKGLSFYKVEDLIEICKKLEINVYNADINCNEKKLKNKNQLYELLIQYF
jgi:hypothetical protein